MERLKLPKGITVNGQTKYFRDTNDTVDRLPNNEHIDHHALKKTSIKGRAFNKPKEPGKLQRVIETINYSKERIKEMEYQKYYDENKIPPFDYIDGKITKTILSERKIELLKNYRQLLLRYRFPKRCKRSIFGN